MGTSKSYKRGGKGRGKTVPAEDSKCGSPKGPGYKGKK